MLSKQEKNELLKDAQNSERKEDLSWIKLKTPPKVKSLDSYLKFLTDLQNMFSHFSVSKHKTITAKNKL